MTFRIPVTAFLFGLSLLGTISASAADRPNVIVFLVDDYDKAECSPYGGPVLTPNLDRLAAEGIRFDDFHVTSTVCTPSRYTILTGRYAGSSHWHGFLEEFPLGQQSGPAFNVALEPDRMNVGRVLSGADYRTGMVGKWHVSPNHDRPYEKNAPWSPEVDALQKASELAAREEITEAGFDWAKNIYAGNMSQTFKGHNLDWTLEAALEFLDGHGEGGEERPFYLHVASTLMHGPNGEWLRSLTDPEKALITDGGKLDEPLQITDRASVVQRTLDAGFTENEAGFTWMDDGVGVLLDKLDALGIGDDTIFVFLADHGSTRKGSLHSAEGTAVPFLVRWPNGAPAGAVSKALVQSTDLVPTWFDLAGAELPDGYHIDGRSMAPLFRDPAASIRDHVFCEQGMARSVKTADFEYIALRWTTDQLEGFRAGDRGTLKGALGLSGGVARTKEEAHGLDADQLYDRNNPGRGNLAANPEYAVQLEQLRALLTADLRGFPGRPFGEFVPGGNATAPADAAARLLRKFNRQQ